MHCWNHSLKFSITVFVISERKMALPYEQYPEVHWGFEVNVYKVPHCLEVFLWDQAEPSEFCNFSIDAHCTFSGILTFWGWQWGFLVMQIHLLSSLKPITWLFFYQEQHQLCKVRKAFRNAICVAVTESFLKKPWLQNHYYGHSLDQLDVYWQLDDPPKRLPLLVLPYLSGK